MPIKVVSERLGHAHPAYTMHTHQHLELVDVYPDCGREHPVSGSHSDGPVDVAGAAPLDAMKPWPGNAS